MIYTGLSRTGEIESVKSHGGADVAEVYGGIGENNPIFYSRKTLTGTPPLTFKGLGQPLTDYLISGNTVQNGTPTPDMPVDVVGCGEKTENLLPPKNTTTVSGITFTAQPDGTTICNGTAEGEFAFGWSVPASISGDYYFSGCPAGGSDKTYDVFCWDKTASARPKQWNGTSASLSDFGTTKNNEVKIVSGHDTEVRIRFRDGYHAENLVFSMMLREPSSPSDFEPYGYKLPLTVNGTEYPIYLGQVPTTRKIRKLVFDGTEETWAKSNVQGGDRAFFEYTTGTRAAYQGANLSSHFETVSVLTATDDIGALILANGILRVRISNMTNTSLANFKSYLAAQYAAGTPVTVWYVLAEPETAIVNEPLHKIGDYADTISMAQAGVTIPTVAGTNTLTVDTTVQPSSVSITGNIKEVQGT